MASTACRARSTAPRLELEEIAASRTARRCRRLPFLRPTSARRLTTRRKMAEGPRSLRRRSRHWCRPAAFAPSRSRCWGKLGNEELPYLLLTGKSLRTVERQVLAHVGDRSRPRHALSHVRGAVRNILAPHRKACQCLFPILPQCDSFLIIVFPVSLAGIFRHMSIEWRIAKKRCIAALNSHLLLGVNAGINGRNDSVRRFRQRSKMRVALVSVAECLSFVVEPDQCGHAPCLTIAAV